MEVDTLASLPPDAQPRGLPGADPPYGDAGYPAGRGHNIGGYPMAARTDAQRRKANAECQRRYYRRNREKCLATSGAWNAAHADRRAATDRAWRAAHREQVLAKQRAYRRAHPERAGAHHLAYYAKYPERKVAERAIYRACRSGKLIRQPCENCGKAPAEAHHDDYGQPLVVRWLCYACHSRHHRAPLVQEQAQ